MQVDTKLILKKGSTLAQILEEEGFTVEEIPKTFHEEAFKALGEKDAVIAKVGTKIREEMDRRERRRTARAKRKAAGERRRK